MVSKRKDFGWLTEQLERLERMVKTPSDCDGAITASYPEGEPLAEGTCREGLVHGQWTMWHPDGTMWQQLHYHYGDRHGTWECWYPDGEPWLRGCFFYGARDGSWESFWATGKPMVQGEYRHDRRHGEWVFFSPDGVEVRREHYFMGEPVVPEDEESRSTE